MNNFDEYLHETDPDNPDSDGDCPASLGLTQATSGCNDGDEVKNGSDPNNPDDSGDPPPPEKIAEVKFTIGDPSSSESERYKLTIKGVEGDTQTLHFASRDFGSVDSHTFKLQKSARYEITITHVGTDPEHDGEPSPDYDYTAAITPVGDACTYIDDPDGILGPHHESENFYARGKKVTLSIIRIVTETEAETPSDRTRRTIGVAEDVEIRLEPTINATWSVVSGGGSIKYDTGSENTFTAGLQQETSTVQFDINGVTQCTVDFNVIRPSGIQYTKISSEECGGSFAGVTMELEMKLLPDTVCFWGIQVREMPSPPVNVWGYFEGIAPSHEPSELWVGVNGDNIIDGSDHALVCGLEPPYSAGGFSWPIPNHFRNGRTREEGGEYVTSSQDFDIDSLGTVKITKGDASGEAAP